MLIEDEEFTCSPETKVGSTPFYQNTSQQDASRRPNIDSITTTTVYVSVHVAFDPIRHTYVGESK